MATGSNPQELLELRRPGWLEPRGREGVRCRLAWVEGRPLAGE